MHILLDLIPFDIEARSVGAEYRVRGIVQICLRVVAQLGHHLIGIVTGGVAVKRHLQPSLALGVGCQGFGIVFQLRRRDLTLQGGQGTALLRRLHFPGHGPQVGNGPPHLGCGQGQHQIVPGFQQYGLCLHQPLAHRPVGCLTEVTAFGVL